MKKHIFMAACILHTCVCVCGRGSRYKNVSGEGANMRVYPFHLSELQPSFSHLQSLRYHKPARSFARLAAAEIPQVSHRSSKLHARGSQQLY